MLLYQQLNPWFLRRRSQELGLYRLKKQDMDWCITIHNIHRHIIIIIKCLSRKHRSELVASLIHFATNGIMYARIRCPSILLRNAYFQSLFTTFRYEGNRFLLSFSYSNGVTSGPSIPSIHSLKCLLFFLFSFFIFWQWLHPKEV